MNKTIDHLLDGRTERKCNFPSFIYGLGIGIIVCLIIISIMMRHFSTDRILAGMCILMPAALIADIGWRLCERKNK